MRRVSNVLNTDTLTPRERTILERRQKLTSLYHAGASVAEIARALEVTTQAVYQMLDRFGLPAPTLKNRP